MLMQGIKYSTNPCIKASRTVIPTFDTLTPTKMSTKAVTNIDIQGKLPKVASGKVRDLYAIDNDTLLFVASDRISAYDVIMENVSAYNCAVSQGTSIDATTGHTRQGRPVDSNVNLLV